MEFASRVLSFKSTVLQNALFLVVRTNYSTQIKPIKMAFNVYKSVNTDDKLPPVVIMHGLFGTKQNWRNVSTALHKATNRKIYTVDARNHGESPHVEGNLSVHLAEDVLHLVQEEQIEPVSVLGHSMGGRAMMQFVMKYRTLVDKAIIVDISPISMPKNPEDVLAIFEAMKNVKVPSEKLFPEARQLAKEQLKGAVSEDSYIDFILLNFMKLPSGEYGWRVNLKALHTNFKQFRTAQQFEVTTPFPGPILFVAAEQSNYIKRDDWPKIKKIFPNAELKWINTGHLVHFTDPQNLVAIVADFLKT